MNEFGRDLVALLFCVTVAVAGLLATPSIVAALS